MAIYLHLLVAKYKYLSNLRTLSDAHNVAPVGVTALSGTACDSFQFREITTINKLAVIMADVMDVMSDWIWKSSVYFGYTVIREPS